MSNEVFECVLPNSGRFARIEKITWITYLQAIAMSKGDAGNFAIHLAAKSVMLDGSLQSPEAWAQEDFFDIAPVNAEISRRLIRLGKPA